MIIRQRSLSMSDLACYRQPRANFETNCRSPSIWELGLLKALDQRLNTIQEGTTSGETCAVAP